MPDARLQRTRTAYELPNDDEVARVDRQPDPVVTVPQPPAHWMCVDFREALRHEGARASQRADAVRLATVSPFVSTRATSSSSSD